MRISAQFWQKSAWKNPPRMHCEDERIPAFSGIANFFLDSLAHTATLRATHFDTIRPKITPGVNLPQTALRKAAPRDGCAHGHHFGEARSRSRQYTRRGA
jgi:hypothetical protein